MNLVSIIVPIYNSEPYLRRTIKSLLNQTYRTLEVCLIDDGSTDDSLKICNEFSIMDDRIKVYHKDNGGEASARNAGLMNAAGEYIMFCDSDDEFLKDSVELLVRAIENRCTDLSVGAYLEYAGDNIKYACTHKQKHTSKEMFLTLMTDFNEYGVNYIMSTVNGKLFKSKIIKTNHILFNESYNVGNDTLFICEYLRYCDIIVDIFSPVYIYYKYDLSERVQGMAWTYPDYFKLVLEVYEKRINYGKIDKSLVLDRLYDTIIRLIVRAIPYEEVFPKGLYYELVALTDNKLFMQSVNHYKKHNIRDSRLIPFFLKHKWISLTLIILRYRSKKSRSACPKSCYVRLIKKIE